MGVVLKILPPRFARGIFYQHLALLNTLSYTTAPRHVRVYRLTLSFTTLSWGAVEFIVGTRKNLELESFEMDYLCIHIQIRPILRCLRTVAVLGHYYWGG